MEFSYQKTLKMPVNQTSLTRTANRFLREYSQMCGEISTDALRFADALRDCNPYFDDGGSDKKVRFTQCADGYRDYDFMYISRHVEYMAIYDKDENGAHVYTVKWNMSQRTEYKKSMIIAGGGVVDITDTKRLKLIMWGYRMRGKYRYFCTAKIPTADTVPTGYATYEQYAPRHHYYGEVTYNVIPDEDDIYRFGLVPDAEWEKERSVWLCGDFGGENGTSD